MNHKDLDFQLGLPFSFNFEAVDETGLPLVLTGTTTKFELFDEADRLKLVKTVTATTTVPLTATDTAILKEGRYTYRTVISNVSGPILQSWKGNVFVDGALFIQGSTPSDGTIVLPDGTLYPTGIVQVVYDVWYAISGLSRLLVSGSGTVGMDGRDLQGNVTGNVSSFQVLNEELQWNPDLSGKVAFRIISIAGNAVVRYLP